jgi:hypothetical protein
MWLSLVDWQNKEKEIKFKNIQSVECYWKFESPVFKIEVYYLVYGYINNKKI